MKKRKYYVCAFLLALIINSCMTMQDVPIEQKPAEELYRIDSYENSLALATLYPLYKSHKYGLIDADFKKYVLEQVENTGYLDIRWYTVHRIGFKYISWAYVYCEKEK